MGTSEPAPTMVARDPAGGWDGVISSKSISTSIVAGTGIGAVVVIGTVVGIDAGTGIGAVVAVAVTGAVIGTVVGIDAGTGAAVSSSSSGAVAVAVAGNGASSLNKVAAARNKS